MSVVLEEVLRVERPGLSLDEFEAAADEWAAAERRRDALVERAQKSISRALAAPGEVRAVWQRMIRQPLETLFGQRDQFTQVVRTWLDTIDLTRRVLTPAERLAGGPLAGSESLAAARAELTTFADRILAVWTSEDELAEVVCDTFELPEWVLKGPNPPGVGFPQHWIDAEDDDPFAPLPESS